jgi:predicted metal-dependent phosphoesterase TrpH
MRRYDLHIHTKYSKCSKNDPLKILKIAKNKGLNGIAVTDHDEIKGAVKTKKLNKDKNFEVIIGEEIKTPQGEVLAYYLNKKIKPGNIEEVIEQIKKQGGLAVLAHPFALIRKSFQGDINKLKNKLDGIECFNSRSFFYWLDKKADKLAEKYHLAKIGGSDAHFGFEIGNGCTEFQDNLRKAIKNKKTYITGTYKYALAGDLLSFLTKRVIRHDFK